MDVDATVADAVVAVTVDVGEIVVVDVSVIVVVDVAVIVVAVIVVEDGRVGLVIAHCAVECSANCLSNSNGVSTCASMPASAQTSTVVVNCIMHANTMHYLAIVKYKKFTSDRSSMFDYSDSKKLKFYAFDQII